MQDENEGSNMKSSSENHRGRRGITVLVCTLATLLLGANVLLERSSENSLMGDIESSSAMRANRTVGKSETSHYFIDDVSLDDLILHGNLIHTRSGCSMARWVHTYPNMSSKDFINDCPTNGASPGHRLENSTEIQPYDTIYVPYRKLSHFLATTFHTLRKPYVLITGQNQLTKAISVEDYTLIVENKYVVKWFMAQMGKFRRHNVSDPNSKVTSFPYGLDHRYLQHYRNEVVTFRNVSKEHLLFLSHLKIQNNVKKRANIPSGNRLPLFQYLHNIHVSRYVLAPDGDRPECHRHYEALLLGTVPLTQLLVEESPHLVGSGVVFDNHEWDTNRLSKLLKEGEDDVAVNRRFAIEEFWMEYVDHLVGRPLKWWDQDADQPATTFDIVSRWREQYKI